MTDTTIPPVDPTAVTYDQLLQKVLETEPYNTWKECGAGRYRDPAVENPSEQLTRFGLYDFKEEKITKSLISLGRGLGLSTPESRKITKRAGGRSAKGIDETRSAALEKIHKKLGIGIDETPEQKEELAAAKEKWSKEAWPLIDKYFRVNRGIVLPAKFFWQLRTTVQHFTHPTTKEKICEIVIPLCNGDGDLVEVLKIQINPESGEKIGKKLKFAADQDRAVLWPGKEGSGADTVLIFEGLENALSVYQAILKVQGEEEVGKYHFCVSCGTSGLGKLGKVIEGYGHRVMFCDPDAAETSLMKSVVLGDQVERRAVKPGMGLEGVDPNGVLCAVGGAGDTANTILLMRWIEELRFVPWWELEEKIAAAGQSEENEAEKDSFEYHRTWNPFSDQGAARYFSARFGRRVKITEDGRWWVWDGKVWSGSNHSEAVIRSWIASLLPTYLKMSMDQRLSEAEQRTAKSFARSLGSAGRQGSILKCIPGMDGIRADVEDFDADPGLLNLQNGVLELSSGRLLAHSPVLMCSRVSRASWVVGAQCPIFQRFLSEITCEAADRSGGGGGGGGGGTTDGSGAELLFYKLRQLGYLLSGYDSEKVLFFHTGTGDNGKSIEAQLLLWLMGDYARVVSTEVLVESAGAADSSAMYQLAYLPGVRLIIANEASEQQAWSESNVKILTGGDTIVARHINKAPFTFKPRFKVVIHGNSNPRVKGGDKAMWGRIQVVPYDFIAVNPDRYLLEKLKLEIDGILQWLYAGFREWKIDGLQPSARVVAAVEDYKHETASNIEEFISEKCSVGEGLRTKAKTLFSAYSNFCKDNGFYSENQTNFGRKLSTIGFAPLKSVGIIYRLGLAVNGDFEPAGDS